ncbi:MAG: NADH:flavin oxidoreductase, partial [Verrucomicrobiota bacterium]|nr:NADH:flavin oxidoreductase [Verrucomicrobiota bacterium]
AGADFVDLKHCHGYLLHEFLSAHTRPGKYGGSFENRTRIMREIIAGIRADGNDIDVIVRLSAFDFVPFRPDAARSQSGKLGPGIPEDFSSCLPYHYGFGLNPDNPLEVDLAEPIQFVKLCAELGVKLVSLSAGSPYYNPHIQRPAVYPPSDGYQPAYDPLIDVERQIQVVRQIREAAPANLAIAGCAYSYLQDFLPHVTQRLVREGWVDVVGLGRIVLSYPDMLSEAMTNGALMSRRICRTFSDCTTGPRNGMISGCFPLDEYYKNRPEFDQLKQIKKSFS